MRTCSALHAIEPCTGGRLTHSLRAGQGDAMGCTWKESPVDGPSDWAPSSMGGRPWTVKAPAALAVCSNDVRDSNDMDFTIAEPLSVLEQCFPHI